MDAKLLDDAFDAVRRRIVRRYGVPVEVTDVRPPNTGDFDGAEIKVGRANDPEAALFVLAHLFGHTVQWTTDEHLRWLGTTFATSAPPERIPELMAYERDASGLALQLFHDVGIRGLDQWVSDWAEADRLYLEHFYRTGERTDFRSLWRAGTTLVRPLPIPEFKPTRFATRSSF